MIMKSHYDTLGLNRDAKALEIRQAYRKKAKQWHPDKNTDKRDFAIEQFQEVNKAYTTLSNKVLKRQYDNDLDQKDNFAEMIIEYLQQTDYHKAETAEENEEFITKEDKQTIEDFLRRVDSTARADPKVQKVSKRIRKTRQ